MKNINVPRSILQEILRNSVLCLVFLYFYKPDLFLAPLTFSEVTHATFILVCVNIPTFIRLYIGKETLNHEQKDNVSFKNLPLEEKIEVAKDVKETVTVKITFKMWLFIFGFTSLCTWYFLRNKDKLTGEGVFLSVFAGVFFSVSLVGLYLIIENGKNKK